jgi:sec-independent protein translocase protein TatA
MGFLGGHEILIILLIVILLFGAKKIPELAKGLGTGIKEFKKASTDAEKHLDTSTETKKENTPKKSEGKNS